MPDSDAFRPSNAYENGVRTLYKYMRYPPDGDQPEVNRELRRRVEALLRDGEAYFPTAAELNDPFEAQPRFRAKQGPPEELFDHYSKALREIHAPEMGWDPPTLEEMERSLRERIRTGELHALADVIEAKYRTEFRTLYPMLCLAATRDSIQMWSYYAESHTGVCVHFDAQLVPIGTAHRVNYSREYPTIWLPIGGLAPDRVVTLALGTKSLAWGHEKEYRLINFPQGPPHPPGSRVFDTVFRWKSPQLAVVPKDRVVGVTLGASIKDDQIEALLRVCQDRRPPLPVEWASLERDQFALKFSRLA